MTDDTQTPEGTEQADAGSGIQLGVSPLGQIIVKVMEGDQVSTHTLSNPQEAWVLAGNLIALASMLFQQGYMAALEEQAMMQQILKPGGIITP
jgi:hypothetical protein